MKKQLAFGLATTLCALGAAVFAGEHGAEKPEMYCIYKETVKPELREQYEAAVKRMVSEFQAYQVDPEKVHWKAVSGPEIGYIYVIPIDGFSGMDAMEANWTEVVEVLGMDKWKDIMKPAAEAMESMEIFHSVKRADLSYVPENPRLKPEEVQYVHYGFYYALPGKAEALEAIAKEFGELYRRKNIDTGWNVYQSVTGSDLPLYVVAQGAKSAADYYSNRERIQKLLGEDAKRIGAKIDATVRKMEYKEGMLRPDLSYPTPDAHAHMHGEGEHEH